MVPNWLHDLSIVALMAGFLCALIVAIDITRHHQPMGIMNVVWPVTGLYAGPLALWGYYVYGRSASHGHGAKHQMHGASETPFYAAVGKGATHCGAGCSLGDIVAEWLAFIVPTIAVWFGYRSIFPDKIFAVWIVDFIFAFSLGIVFQYFAIAPMRGLGLRAGLVAAVKADTLSLTAWQVGMYGFMALAHFYFFGVLIGAKLEVNSVEFWFMMQIAMLCGFVTSYPVNWWLIETGIKERM
jgi:hypothetical protein